MYFCKKWETNITQSDPIGNDMTRLHLFENTVIVLMISVAEKMTYNILLFVRKPWKYARMRVWLSILSPQYMAHGWIDSSCFVLKPRKNFDKNGSLIYCFNRLLVWYVLLWMEIFLIDTFIPLQQMEAVALTLILNFLNVYRWIPGRNSMLWSRRQTTISWRCIHVLHTCSYSFFYILPVCATFM